MLEYNKERVVCGTMSKKMKDIFVANSFSGEMFCVDKTVISIILGRYKRGVHLKSHESNYTWTKRSQTILDMLRSGW